MEIWECSKNFKANRSIFTCKEQILWERGPHKKASRDTQRRDQSQMKRLVPITRSRRREMSPGRVNNITLWLQLRPRICARVKLRLFGAAHNFGPKRRTHAALYCCMNKYEKHNACAAVLINHCPAIRRLDTADKLRWMQARRVKGFAACRRPHALPNVMAIY